MRNFFTKDLGWKLFSLALAFAVWLTVEALRPPDNQRITPAIAGALTTHRFDQLPVIAMSAAADPRAVAVSPVAVDVTVSGRSDIIQGLDPKEIRVTVDLTEIESASDLRKRVDVSAPLGVALMSVEPAFVTVVIPPKQKN
jgi:YbbR domain-containing protein